MKEKLLFLLAVFFSYFLFGENRLDTSSTQSALKIMLKAIDGSSSEEIFSTRISGDTLNQSQLKRRPVPSVGISVSGKTCFDVVMINNGGDCGTLTGRASQKADFTLPATNTQNYIFTPTGTVSNVRLYYSNTNGQPINSIRGGNSGNSISDAVTAIVKYNTNLNDLAAGTTRATALTANIIVVYNDGPTNNGTDHQLVLTVNVQDCACCGAYIAPGQWKNFMCQNLGADMSADPFTPSASIHGAKYQWGAKTGEAGRAISQVDDQTNAGAISGWFGNTDVLPDNTWRDDIKTLNDPCPAGYRVPTSAQWQGVTGNNNIARTGSWVNSAINYTTAITLGTSLLLPTAGYRGNPDGELYYHGSSGSYWSSTQHNSFHAYSLSFNSSNINVNANYRTYGFNIRCIAE